jgi:hypothetical protein
LYQDAKQRWTKLVEKSDQEEDDATVALVLAKRETQPPPASQQVWGSIGAKQSNVKHGEERP